MERLRANVALSAALSAVTAAVVVGVILNLALWFAIHVVLARGGADRGGPLSLEWPVLSSVDWAAAGLSALAHCRGVSPEWGWPQCWAGRLRWGWRCIWPGWRDAPRTRRFSLATAGKLC